MRAPALAAIATALIASLGVSLGASSAIAQPAPQDDAIVSKNDIPKTVAQQITCGTAPETILRKPFADGFVFRWPCSGNHANQIEALIYATTVDGANAQLLRFPMPGQPSKVKPATEISNIAWFPQLRELSSMFIDPEARICRREGRWQLKGKKIAPSLIFWRETRDCDGKRGWRIVLNQTRPTKSK